jgi:transposase
MLHVGIDWASDHHDVCLTNDSAQTLAAFRIEPEQVLVALETTRGLLVHDQLRSGYQVYAINPKAVSRYKDRYVVSKAKSDSLDASCLAHLLRTDLCCANIIRVRFSAKSDPDVTSCNVALESAWPNAGS